MPFDHALMFMSTGNLTKTGYAANALKIRKSPVSGYGVRIAFPSTPGTTAPVLPSLYVSDDNSTYRLAATYDGGAQSWASGGEELVFGFMTRKKYAKVYFTITSGTSGTSYGPVKAGLILPGSFDWSRATSFD